METSVVILQWWGLCFLNGFRVSSLGSELKKSALNKYFCLEAFMRDVLDKTT